MISLLAVPPHPGRRVEAVNPRQGPRQGNETGPCLAQVETQGLEDKASREQHRRHQEHPHPGAGKLARGWVDEDFGEPVPFFLSERLPHLFPDDALKHGP